MLEYIFLVDSDENCTVSPKHDCGAECIASSRSSGASDSSATNPAPYCSATEEKDGLPYISRICMYWAEARTTGKQLLPRTDLPLTHHTSIQLPSYRELGVPCIA